MPLAYRWDLRLGSSDISSVYKRIYTFQPKHAGVSPETKTTYNTSTSGTVGWNVNIDDDTYYRTVEIRIYREIFGFSSGFAGPAGMDVSEYRSEMADILDGKPVEPAAADASTYTLVLELNDTINVGTEIALLSSQARKHFSGGEDPDESPDGGAGCKNPAYLSGSHPSDVRSGKRNKRIIHQPRRLLSRH